MLDWGNCFSDIGLALLDLVVPYQLLSGVRMLASEHRAISSTSTAGRDR
jgi:hypothetical protein